jgi:hypothetical protein
MADKDDSGRSVGRYSVKLEGIGAKLESPASMQSGKKAIMFVPEGVDVKNADLDIEVVALDAATFEAMGPRRC